MSVTAVPLRPIKPGSVRRFWLVMVLLFAVAIVLAWAGSRQFGQMPSGLRYQMLEKGTGASPTKEDFALVAYKGMLPDGTVFDENPGAPMELASMVPGFTEAVTKLRKGGKMRAWIPAALGYGDHPPQGSPIPPNSPLVFEIKLLEFKTRAEVMEQQRAMQLQQMMQQQQQQQGGGAAPGGPEGALPPGMEGPPPGVQ
ncbi:FKBP-type peptidyl-prolyl cis-trans isomerase [Sphingobium nicotianae]|uniref:Peptidyl-prolyl cis-trans isomerase n=1 Tax=Sphingobium nicotianae TaxID=2782607 RepID=A0A9X1DC09_9SPHN|nr:FKBP-type peptidyl-prolyl cis-trans isomerase [Sphingobium nicotianae]MBT2187222.1 FKBP-type peptidyl-prolyl cis-trans isomerase [Sphingobium nicotianae]